jgi:lipopolysaccharide/colanic/teichoic acid biosynthesis glycosyltransferase
MTFFYHLKNLLSLNNSKPIRTGNSLLSEKAFRKSLELERARSDRYGNMFSLLVFEPGNSNRHPTNGFALADILINRVRPTDQVGWFKKAGLAVVLPSTTYEGAVKLADDVCQQIEIQKQKPPTFKVYTYPAGKLDKMDKKLKDLLIEKNECLIQELSEIQERDIHVGHCKHLTNSSAPLFLKPLPVWKRGIDILGSLFGLLLLSPLFLAIAVILKIVSPGPVFFTQQRIGYLGRPFTMFKFRTMKVNADATLHENHVTELIQNGKPLEKMDGQDPRIFPFGKFMRLTGMDELPQLIHILRGEMSLVGPRPELPCSIQYCEPWQSRRFETKPGLSGLWQISGKTTTTFTEMMRLDISYVNKRSFWLDLVILLKTLPTILREARR